ncbi:helix-turn-helix transcriptional regulator [Kitasatospora sp. NPDC057198]|uniref:helix-turn-helix transcriptional regulator n=1 Tax=Kitasatospora sp. NPDC057198 TaxID=3346046 RepID=UPI00363852CE
MSGSPQRQQELAAFLRSRRERRTPEAAGLPNTGRRRTPGLRREELAALAGVSASWYTWLEQGRRIRVSRQVLAGLSGALGLDRVERAHLFRLADEAPPGALDEETPVPGALDEGAPGPGAPAGPLPANYRLLLEQLDPNPAFMTGPRFDVLGWNRGQQALFGGFEQVPPADRNVLWLMFTSPGLRALHEDWEQEAAHTVALFRSQAGDRLLRPEYAALVARLREASDEFRALWERHDLAGYTPRSRTFVHPRYGRLTLDYVKMHAADGAPTLVAHLLPPGSAVAAAIERQVAAERAAEARAAGTRDAGTRDAGTRAAGTRAAAGAP